MTKHDLIKACDVAKLNYHIIMQKVEKIAYTTTTSYTDAITKAHYLIMCGEYTEEQLYKILDMNGAK